MKRFTSVEARIDAAAHGVLDRLPARGLSGALVEFAVFGLKQAWACLFAATALLYLRTTVHYRVFRFRHRMPLLFGFLLVALFIWFAENIGTWSRAWIYPNQSAGWAAVPPDKLGSWYLLMIVSFVLVTLVHRPQAPDAAEPAAVRACRSGG